MTFMRSIGFLTSLVGECSMLRWTSQFPGQPSTCSNSSEKEGWGSLSEWLDPLHLGWNHATRVNVCHYKSEPQL